jgi:hypothetical protein
LEGEIKVIQRFIELGEGYSDLYELVELARANQHRLMHLMAIHTKINDKDVSSLVIVLKPTNPGGFQALYICREGIPNPHVLNNKRFDIFRELADELDKTIIEFDAKPSTMFPETELYYQHLIGILRLNHYIPPLQ